MPKSSYDFIVTVLAVSASSHDRNLVIKSGNVKFEKKAESYSTCIYAPHKFKNMPIVFQILIFFSTKHNLLLAYWQLNKLNKAAKAAFQFKIPNILISPNTIS